MFVWPWLMTSPLCSSVSQSAKRLLWISQLASDFINNTSLEADYGRHGASQRAANCKRVMKTQFRLGGRAFFSLTIGLWIHRRGQHNPTSAMFMIKPGDPQPLWLWYILTDQVNRLVRNSRGSIYPITRHLETKKWFLASKFILQINSEFHWSVHEHFGHYYLSWYTPRLSVELKELAQVFQLKKKKNHRF